MKKTFALLLLYNFLTSKIANGDTILLPLKVYDNNIASMQTEDFLSLPSEFSSLEKVRAKENSVTPIVAQDWAKKISIKPKTGPTDFILPFACNLKQYYVAGVLKVSESHIIVNGQWQLVQSKNFDDVLQAIKAIVAIPEKQKKVSLSSAIKINISSSTSDSSHNLRADSCLNLLFAIKLSENFRVLAPIGLKYRYFLKSWFNFQKAQRANRNLQVHWQDGNTNKPFIRADIKVAESIFGRALTESFKLQFDLSKNYYEGIEKLHSFLNEENKQLDLNSLPKVVKTYGAWAYLNKGRAWGLEMNDRLVAGIDSKKVYGHVVGYFGLEEKIYDENRRLVREGAILFIRSGQKRSTIGLTFDWDRQEYPVK